MILDRSFLGQRYAQLEQEYPVSMTNYWPYLRRRREEMYQGKEAYNASLLAKVFGPWQPISERLWCSPDNEKQLGIALRYEEVNSLLCCQDFIPLCCRFLLTRAWFVLSVGSPLHKTGLKIIIIDAQEVVKDEIWSVTISEPSWESTSELESHTFYILEQTCEVIGRTGDIKHSRILLRPPSWNTLSFIAPTTLIIPSHSFSLRVDWSDYVQTRLLPVGFHATPPPTLLTYLRWPNVEDYDKGVSRLWLRRIEKEGEVGAYKKVVAERYVMASVVGNR